MGCGGEGTEVAWPLAQEERSALLLHGVGQHIRIIWCAVERLEAVARSWTEQALRRLQEREAQ